MNEGLFRYRVRYVKRGRLRHLAHLEVLGTVDRCVRRSGLPFDVTNGFSPRMRIQFSSALPVGASSGCEYYDLYLRELVDAEDAIRRLVAASPTDLAPVRAGYVPTALPAIEAWLARMSWRVALAPAPDADGAPLSAATLADALAEVRAQGELEYLRGERVKRVDLASTLVGVEVGEGPEGPELRLDTRTTPAGSLRPSVLVEAALGRLGVDASSVVARVERVGQWGEDEHGELLDPLAPTGADA